MGNRRNKEGKGFSTGFVLGAFCGFLATVWMETEPHDDFYDKVRLYAAKVRRFSFAFVSEARDRVSEASKEGRRAAKRERYSAYLDDWDLNNPDL